MTTTNVFSGNFMDKPSSKVLAPPGGGSSFSFGDGSDEPPRQPRQQQQPRTNVLSQPPQQDCSPVKSAKPTDAAGQSQMNLFGAGDPEPSPKPQSGKRRYEYQDTSTGFNLLSGEPSASAQGGARGKQQKEKVDPANMPAAGGRLEDRQVTRKEPPGGKSSFSFGGN